jgi:hypothetical protein
MVSVILGSWLFTVAYHFSINIWTIWAYIIFFLNPTVNTLCFNYRLCTEFVPDMDASSREWRSGATPTTDCEAQWMVDFRVFLQKIERILLWKDLQSFSKYKWCAECTSDRNASSWEWQTVEMSTADYELCVALHFLSSVLKIKRIIMNEPSVTSCSYVFI